MPNILDFEMFVNEQKKSSDHVENAPIRIFCDMDGVLTDFKRGFKRLKANKNHRTPDEYESKYGKNSIWPLVDHRKEKFWKRLPWTKDGRELWDYLSRYTPYILSAPSRSNYSIDGKLEWLSLNLGINQKKPITSFEEHEADPEKRVILSKDKETFVRDKNDVLIDDKDSNIKKWTEAGGTGILHNDSTDTIRLIEEIISDLQGGFDEDPNDESEEETDSNPNPEPETQEGP